MLLAATIDPARVTPGLLGFGITVMLGLATWLLLRSMNRHIGRVDFAEDPAPSPAARARPGEAPGPGAAAEGDPPGGSGRPAT